MNNPFGLSTRLKIAWWKTEAVLRRQHRLVWYLIGILGGWILCSEYNIWLDTGVWTTFPWQ